ncbi:hypothetical protein V0288_01220 [Pannus brasiliensis CCIBt3594]|uniref:Uncharacterized protein n=1 Tax=Pannus brasiliensis CCIBt3594 TaxID=1427578 RepID=A0AAW9QR08_9CHRO
MTAVTENDLKRLEDLIISRFSSIENSIGELKQDVKALQEGQKALEVGQAEIVKSVEVNKVELKGEIKTLEAKIDGFNERSKSIDKIPDLAEKIGELKNWRSIAISILGAVAGPIAWNSMVNNP